MSANKKQEIKESVRCLHFCACCAQLQLQWIGDASAILLHRAPVLGCLMPMPGPSPFEVEGAQPHTVLWGYHRIQVYNSQRCEDPLDGSRDIYGKYLVFSEVWCILEEKGKCVSGVFFYEP